MEIFGISLVSLLHLMTHLSIFSMKTHKHSFHFIYFNTIKNIYFKNLGILIKIRIIRGE